MATTVTLEAGDFGWDYLLVADDGRDRLIQLDYDYPGVASNLGWSPAMVKQTHCHVSAGEEHDCDTAGSYHENCPDCCLHEGTDGTIGCLCGVKASEFIGSARAWLDDHTGESFDDPGYFDGES